MKNQLIIPLLMLITLLSLDLTGCQVSRQKIYPTLPDIGASPDHLNEDLEITLLPSRNSFEIGDVIVLNVSLKSDIEVKSDAGFDARIFILDSEKHVWLEIQDLASQGGFGANEIVLNPQNRNGSITIHPGLEENDEEATLLIMIKGAAFINDDATGWVASYVIVTLKP